MSQNQQLTVGQLRKALEGIPDGAPVEIITYRPPSDGRNDIGGRLVHAECLANEETGERAVLWTMINEPGEEEAET
ncbi:hypothetical protein ACFQU7_01810 [Pseudoroseomonas wenyumeiae]